VASVVITTANSFKMENRASDQRSQTCCVAINTLALMANASLPTFLIAVSLETRKSAADNNFILNSFMLNPQRLYQVLGG